MRIPKTGVRNDSIVSHSSSAFLHTEITVHQTNFIRMECTLLTWVLIVWYFNHNPNAKLEN